MKIHVKQIAFAAMAMALAVVTSMIKIFSLPMGGSVTLLSMLFIVLIGYWFGLKVGLVADYSLHSFQELYSLQCIHRIFFNSSILYSLAYNGSYIGAEAVITIIIIMLPPVNKALGYLKNNVVNS